MAERGSSNSTAGRASTAIDPASGNTYTLDSGFKPAPEAYLAAFFNTPCLQSPEGKVAFGEIQLPAH